ncbi:MAG: DNA helicase RecG [Syntrophus sp. (in: bacteria)]|nr:DNA helicase RecG [Syntrophus sp. (in: bacteria)]
MGKRNKSLNESVECLKGVGPKILASLEKRGIRTIGDLFFFLPLRYEDKRRICRIDEAREGEKAVIVAKVASSRPVFYRNARKKAYEAIVEDDTGSMTLKWFYWPPRYLKGLLRKGNVLLISGDTDRFGDLLQIVHPEVTLLSDEGEAETHKAVIPVYPEIEGIKQGTIRNLLSRAFQDYEHHVESLIPEELGGRHGLVSFRNACRAFHFPDNDAFETTVSHEYLERLILEEFFLFQTVMLIKRREIRKEQGMPCRRGGLFSGVLRKGLSFKLTGAQEKAIEEILKDMAGHEPMNRLLQGDVGCGKTICAVLAACNAVDSGYQVAFMAPTEILAEQHFLTVHRFFEGLGISLAYLRGNMGKERREILGNIEAGKVSVVIGTHALIQKDVVFRRLGLVIVDEQHRFGVMERKRLKHKGNMPHVLVMSATPIPRTLSLVLYGDLDVSIINAMPEGRQKIFTKIFTDDDKAKAYGILEEELDKGHQAFIVYPLVEESDKMELLNARGMAVHLKSVFPGRRIGLLHGRMRADEKERVMSAFKERKIDLLVCTTVIEVGIDIPNATLIIIEHAERFGLSQLHQLRGRVGRSIYPSKCLLVASAKRTDQAARRLKAMEKTADGFMIAEKDMEIRGPGEMLGVRQSGIPDFRVGDVRRDGEIMIRARKIAREALDIWQEDDINEIKGLLNLN